MLRIAVMVRCLSVLTNNVTLHGLRVMFSKAQQTAEMPPIRPGWRVSLKGCGGVQDLEACVWLEETLKKYKRILLMVSHSQVEPQNSACPATSDWLVGGACPATPDLAASTVGALCSRGAHDGPMGLWYVSATQFRA